MSLHLILLLALAVFAILMGINAYKRKGGL